MPVTVDDAPLPAEELGLSTVGQVLTHLKRGNRLVINILIDGREPDLDRLGDVRKSAIGDRSIFIETADPRQMAREVLKQVAAHLDQAEQLKNAAADLFQKNQPNKAMQKLAGCFTAWQHAQDSLTGAAQITKIDLEKVRLSDRTLSDLLNDVGSQLKMIKSALENRDYVALTDLLVYDTTQISAQWRQAIEALRVTIG
jgi:hypothetical protein